MNSKFSYYLINNILDVEEIKEWDDAFISFDTNFLLHFYEYSDKSVESLFKCVKSVQDRMIESYYCIEEYLTLRVNKISENSKLYDKTKKSIQDLCSQLENQKAHPFISDEKLLKEYIKSSNSIIKNLDKNKSLQQKKIRKDEHLEEFFSIFTNKIIQEFSNSELESFYKNGKNRFANKIPPGFKDQGKKQEPYCYNDYIIWESLIKFSTDNKKDLIFVSDDRKEDWAKIVDGLNLGMLPKLKKEFHEKTGRNIILLSTETFINYVANKTGENVDEDLIKEVKMQSEVPPYKVRFDKNKILKNELERYELDLFHNFHMIESLKAQRNKIMHLCEHLSLNSEKSEEDIYKIEKLKMELEEKSKLISEYKHIHNKLIYEKKLLEKEFSRYLPNKYFE
ncbi:MAG: PIN domain-containing protein [Pleomorphochaeta sp.]